MPQFPRHLGHQWVTGDNEPGGLTNSNGTLYFRDWDYAHGKELWRVTVEP